MKSLLIALLLMLPSSLLASSPPAATVNKEYTSWLQQMKTQPLGPFKDVMWFCMASQYIDDRCSSMPYFFR